MSNDNVNRCGCKGVRTCLICEKDKGWIRKNLSTDSLPVPHTYCPLCNLCWPVVKEFSTSLLPHNGKPFFVSGICVVSDFITKEEEDELVKNIDRLPWMPSQSGRKKQDFGPKVNFKKQKLKLSTFKGFPQFVGEVIGKFQQVPQLVNFLPVELCNLEYCPERGSAIEPHLDDCWLWGEHLITVNLLSTTVLTLTPVEFSTCSCILGKLPADEQLSFKIQSIAKNLCELPKDHITAKKTKRSQMSNGNVESRFEQFCKTDEVEDNVSQIIQSLSISEETNESCANYSKAEIHVELPPRSLVILSGCARYHWNHEIRREHITQRRLAMTFRELSAEFLDGGKEWEVGKELLDLAKPLLQV